MGASKYMGVVQAYRGHPNRGHPSIQGHPNIEGPSKHIGASKHMGHPNTQWAFKHKWVSILMGASKYMGIWTPL